MIETISMLLSCLYFCLRDLLLRILRTVAANNECIVLAKNSSWGTADNRFLVITDICNCSKTLLYYLRIWQLVLTEPTSFFVTHYRWVQRESYNLLIILPFMLALSLGNRNLLFQYFANKVTLWLFRQTFASHLRSSTP